MVNCRPFASKAFFLRILSSPFIVIRNSKRRTQNPSKSLKKPLLRQKDDYKPQALEIQKEIEGIQEWGGKE